jgi:cytochrome c oxidase subunit 4
MTGHAAPAHHEAHHPDHGEHITPVPVYLALFGALMVLTVITVAVAWVNLGVLNIVVALVVAVVKASLVVLYFMHLKYSPRLTWVVMASGFFWLVILLGLLMADYATRGWMPAPPIVR